MANEILHQPSQYPGVFVSSTFLDLKVHRKILMEALRKEELFAIGMEEYVSSPEDDVISSSLTMVRNGSAYIGLISHRYGQNPECDSRNPDGYSITRLEYEEALRLGRPTLMFIMGENHPVTKNDVETDSEKIIKLQAFRERAMESRIHYEFNSLEDFSTQAIHAVGSIRRCLEEKMVLQAQADTPAASPGISEKKADPTPVPPHFYAEPSYIGSHKFVGRQAQLETLTDWASPADSHPVMLFEAIGGTGKSILTWEWTTKHSSDIRDDWAGRFWYSFYEKGATMVDFCRRALAYMTQRPRSDFRERNTAELMEPLIHHLKDRPWLLILDGLERVLVSYHRYDASQIRDEEAGIVDKIARRDPCAAINPEDDDLLRTLSGASPSKLLLTSRLVPRVLLNKSNQAIPGVLREHLPGLRPADAELLIRACGITGDSRKIQTYLKSHCDCHPLVVGVLAGLINDYLPDRGNFDAWAADPNGGDQLDLADLDLIQKRNHILKAALSALPVPSRQLLSTLALLSESVDYPTICALSPLIPAIPEEVPSPKTAPEQSAKWETWDDEERAKAREKFHNQVQRRREYEDALKKREEEMISTSPELTEIVKDLEHRGLLQYDPVSKRHDLHPVVRGISAGGLKLDEKSRYGQLVVDHFTQHAEDPFSQVESIKDLDNSRHIVQVLFQMGKMEEARNFVISNNLIETLNNNFEAHNEILAILRPFFSEGWNVMPECLRGKNGVPLARRAAVALRRIGALQDAFDVSEMTLNFILEKEIKHNLFSQLTNLASTLGEQNQLAKEARVLSLARDLAFVNKIDSEYVSLWMAKFRQLARLAQWPEAEYAWAKLNEWELSPNAESIAAHHYAVYLYLRDELTEEALARAEELNVRARSALGSRNLRALRGFWFLDKGDFEMAKDCLQDAVTLAHKAGKVDRRSEIRLNLAKFHLNDLPDTGSVAEQFEYNIEEACHLPLANFFLAIGKEEKAKKHAHAAYVWAWADGYPFSRGFELKRAESLLKVLDVPIPLLEPYKKATKEKMPWERKAASAISTLRNIRKASRGRR